eukprot:scaffold148379_cov41-Prasinocladus_malaysianus.AAC.1
MHVQLTTTAKAIASPDRVLQFSNSKPQKPKLNTSESAVRCNPGIPNPELLRLTWAAAAGVTFDGVLFFHVFLQWQAGHPGGGIGGAGPPPAARVAQLQPPEAQDGAPRTPRALQGLFLQLYNMLSATLAVDGIYAIGLLNTMLDTMHRSAGLDGSVDQI